MLEGHKPHPPPQTKQTTKQNQPHPPPQTNKPQYLYTVVGSPHRLYHLRVHICCWVHKVLAVVHSEMLKLHSRQNTTFNTRQQRGGRYIRHSI
ncbi:hypothetical protein J6590_006612 [Homalodisca vitripennis]|nr:hypothetical protein J6590_006612 [Homalodisca vitripennis]